MERLTAEDRLMLWPDEPTGLARAWTPAPLPPARALVADNLRRHAAGLGGAFSALARPADAARQVRAMAPAMRGMFIAPPTPRTSLDQAVGPGCRLPVIRGSLDLARQVAHRHGAKVKRRAAGRHRRGSTCPSPCGKPNTANRPAET